MRKTSKWRLSQKTYAAPSSTTVVDCNVFEDLDTMTRAIHPTAITGANVFDDAYHTEVKRENLKRTNSSSYDVSDDNIDNDDNCLPQNSWDALLKDISNFKIHHGEALARQKCERLLPVTSLVVVQASFPTVGRLSGTANIPS